MSIWHTDCATLSVLHVFVRDDVSLMLIYIDIYYTSFPDEPRLYKAVVCVVYVVETVNAMLSTYDLGHMLTDHNYYPYLTYWVTPICGAIGMLTFLRIEAEAENLKWCH